MTDTELEMLRDWLITTIAAIEEMGGDDQPLRRTVTRAANGRFVKAR